MIGEPASDGRTFSESLREMFVGDRRAGDERLWRVGRDGKNPSRRIADDQRDIIRTRGCSRVLCAHICESESILVSQPAVRRSGCRVLRLNCGGMIWRKSSTGRFGKSIPQRSVIVAAREVARSHLRRAIITFPLFVIL